MEDEETSNIPVNDEGRLQGIFQVVYPNGTTNKKHFKKLRDYFNSITGSNTTGSENG